MVFPASNLSQENILRDVHDASNQTLRVTAVAVIDTVIVELDFNNDSVTIGDVSSGNTLNINSDGSIDSNIEVDAADGDNIAISDGVNILAIGTNGSINANIIPNTNTSSVYNEISSVAAFSTTTILTSIVGANSLLKRVDVSGDNIATYEVLINATVKDKRRSYFGNSLNCEFEFEEGLPVSSGDTILVRVTHERPDLGTFNARIQLLGV